MGQVISFKEALTSGLKPDNRSSRSLRDMLLYTNMIPTSMGARPAQVVEELISAATLSGAGITFSSPHPQLFRGGQKIWLADDNGIYEVTSEENGTITGGRATYDIYNTGNLMSVDTGGGSWHYMDLQSSFFFVNNSNVIFKTKWEDPDKYFVEKTSKFTTGCVWRGRCLTEGLDSTAYWNATWLSRFQSLYSKGSGSWGLAMTQPETNFICWGPVGASGLVNLFLPDQVFNDGDIGSVEGGHSASDPIFQDMVQRGDWGFMPVEWTGEILMLKPMRKGVVVYGDSRISVLVPSNAGGIPGFGLIEQSHGIGINSRSAVGGGLDEHLFLDNQGSLWLMDGDFQVTKVGGEGTRGYRHLLNAFQGQDIVINYDRDEDAYFISGDTVCYRWTRQNGLSQHNQLVTSGWQAEGAFAGIVTDVASPAIASLTFPTFRASSVGRVQLICRDTNAIKASVFLDHRTNPGGVFTSGSEVVVDNEGFAIINLTDFEGRLRLTHPDNTKLQLDDVLIHPIEGGKSGIKVVMDA